ncbi:aromatic amino acid lyase [Actinoplanes sp. NPDC020271]|uniref:aromatic amino acid lyase n=1 Tax=Actinoplanes sp. NPDC020271 TaxID=3363896 RepID=UPI0037ADCB4A
MTGELRVRTAADLGRTEIGLVASGAKRIVLAPELLAGVAASRAAALRALDGDQPVYGVNTGMGALAGIRLDAEARARHQDTLMAGRAVGSAPWLRPDQARAVMAVRLRTLLHPAAGVSPELCRHLADLVNAGLAPAIPARGVGAAGEIIPLAHLGAVLIGTGQVLDDAGRAVDVAGVPARSFEAKEGVAFLEGVPGLTGLAILATAAARTLAEQVIAVAGAAQAVVGASADPLRSELASGDDVLRSVNAALLKSRGDGPSRALQAPVSFRVTGPALAVVIRAAGALDAAAERALTGITDSPAHLDGRFYGTAGFAGTELAAACGALTGALVHLAEVGTARLHRLLDPAVTGLPKQLSDAPGVHAGMVSVHKRAAGVAHRLRRFAMPALLGAMETSGGQEDVQSFGFEAAECLDEAVDGLREVLACELLAVHQARLLSGDPAPILPVGTLPAGTADRPFGRDLDALIALLRSGWSSSAR